MSNINRTRIIKSALAGGLALLLAGAAFAQDHKGHMHATHRISAKQAERNALKKYPGKVVGKVALENEEGKWQYSVNIRSGHTLREVMVDAGSGKIADVEVTSAKEEAKEAANEKKQSHHGKH